MKSTTATHTTKRHELILTELSSRKQLCISDEIAVLGREGDGASELFSNLVSRHHLVIRRMDKGWRLSHVGTNPTTLIRPSRVIKLETEQEVKLRAGDIIRIADISLKVEAT